MPDAEVQRWQRYQFQVAHPLSGDRTVARACGDEIVDQEAGFRGDGLVVPAILFDELFEIGEFLGGEDEGLGVDAGFEGVHGRDGFACYRGGAGWISGHYDDSLRFAGELTFLTPGGGQAGGPDLL